MDLDNDDDDGDLPDFFKSNPSTSTSTHPTTKTAPKKQRGKVTELIREKVRIVLEEKTQLADKRARTCEEGDFLKLLWNFNSVGIHFTL
jgi:18S rRNA (adenine1779-N6/adenine1780-N6)-dimethyltransferase